MNAIDKLRAQLTTLTDPAQIKACEARIKQYESIYSKRTTDVRSRVRKACHDLITLLHKLDAHDRTQAKRALSREASRAWKGDATE